MGCNITRRVNPIGAVFVAMIFAFTLTGVDVLESRCKLGSTKGLSSHYTVPIV